MKHLPASINAVSDLVRRSDTAVLVTIIALAAMAVVGLALWVVLKVIGG